MTGLLVPRLDHSLGYDDQIKQLLSQILEHGERRKDRTGVGTIAMFGGQLAIDLADGLPATTLRKIHLRAVVHELLWFLRGDTNIRYLRDNKVTIWDEWADENDSIGPGYGKQWRKWIGEDGVEHDQIADIVQELRTNPTSRRILLSAWNVADLKAMALMPCHVSYNFSTIGGRLSCHLYQRSQDQLALSYNACTGAILTTMLAKLAGLEPGHFVHSWGDVHIYSNHVDAVREMISRPARALPRLELNPNIGDIDDFTAADITIKGYDPHARLDMPVAV